MVFRIDSAGSVAALPTPAAPGTGGYFSTPTPLGSGQSTIVSADWLNSQQEELIAIVTAAGLTPTKGTNNQVLSAIQALTRIKLSADLNLYVATTGSDSNNGTTSGTPFATLQHAMNVIMTVYDLNNHKVTVNIANGTYTSGVTTLGNPVGYGPNSQVTFLGNVTTPSNVVINVTNGDCFSVSTGANINVQGMTLQASGTQSDYVGAGVALGTYSGIISFSHIAFGACGVAHMSSLEGGAISSVGNPYSIVGGAAEHIAAQTAASVATADSVVTISGTPAFTYFVFCDLASIVDCWNMTFTGTGATGQRYNVSFNGVIDTNGGGASYLPGNVAGTASNGGLYE